MKKQLILLTLLTLINSANSPAVDVIYPVNSAIDEQMTSEEKLETGSMPLRNSMQTGLRSNVYCSWSKISETSAELDYCFRNDYHNKVFFGVPAMIGGTSWGKYDVQSRGKITYDSSNCYVFMGQKPIGLYFGGKCFEVESWRFDGRPSRVNSTGFRIIDATVIIDEENLQIKID